MAFTPEEEKNIILQWVYSIYKRLGGMSVDEIYIYLLGQTKESLIQELEELLGAKDDEASTEGDKLVEYRANIKDYQKKLKKL